LVALAVLELLRYLTDFLKFRREASYHMWSSKILGNRAVRRILWPPCAGFVGGGAILRDLPGYRCRPRRSTHLPCAAQVAGRCTVYCPCVASTPCSDDAPLIANHCGSFNESIPSGRPGLGPAVYASRC
jgi:hypothetical protein